MEIIVTYFIAVHMNNTGASAVIHAFDSFEAFQIASDMMAESNIEFRVFEARDDGKLNTSLMIAWGDSDGFDFIVPDYQPETILYTRESWENHAKR